MLGCLLTTGAQASSAVAVGRDGGYGYCYGPAPKSDAELCALKKCREVGGVECKVMVSSRGRGYGAIAVSSDTRRPSVGAAIGMSTSNSAIDAALGQCEKRGHRCRVKYDWNDNR